MGRISTKRFTFYLVIVMLVASTLFWFRCMELSYPSGIHDQIRRFVNLEDTKSEVDLTVKFLGQSVVPAAAIERLENELTDQLTGNNIRALKTMSSSELDPFIRQDVSDDALDDYLDKEHCASSGLSHYCLFVIHRNGTKKRGVIGRHRLAWIEVDNAEVSNSDTSTLLAHMLLYMTRCKLQYTDLGGKNEYKLLFNLINEDGTRAKSWDFEAIEKEFLDQTTEALNSVLNLTIESQILYHHRLNLEPIYDQKKYYYFPFDMLKDSLNYDSIASRSGLDKSPFETILYFNLFIPSTDHSPLAVQVSPSQYTPAFVDLDFGGFVFHSCDPEDASSTLDLADLRLSFSLFRSQLRQLLGFSEFEYVHVFQNISFYHIPNKKVGFAQWELDCLARHLISKNILEVKKILHAFSLILDRKHVVLEDHIFRLVELSIQSGIASRLQSEKALEHSSRSLWYAKQLESDPDMLPLYTFPTEKTYIVFLPLVMSLPFPAIKYVLEQRRRKNAK
ncbi:GPI transamidase component PIG-S-like [Schistocerca gregaria]|uniref:GPI transamidase component PIG-S-like n=1 Tax=Schistocerca gregaria TaxID=7010 RepID=UPI00211E8874|nr:GPI transamidase component PIG-S-like [Schistocerca gregaria]